MTVSDVSIGLTSFVTVEYSDLELTGVFENPEAAYNFNLTGNPWDDESNDFPLSEDLLQQITQSIVSGEASIAISSPPDVELDNLSNTAQTNG
jgi:hypothetical protein